MGERTRGSAGRLSAWAGAPHDVNELRAAAALAPASAGAGEHRVPARPGPRRGDATPHRPAGDVGQQAQQRQRVDRRPHLRPAQRGEGEGELVAQPAGADQAEDDGRADRALQPVERVGEQPAGGGLLAELSPRLPFFLYAGFLLVAGAVGIALLRSAEPDPAAPAAAVVVEEVDQVGQRIHVGAVPDPLPVLA